MSGNAAGNVDVKLRVQKGTYSQEIDRVQSQLNKLKGTTQSWSHSSVSGTQAASAAIRLLEGNTNNMVRAAENFVSRSRVLSGVLKTAFPVIGAVAIGNVLAEGISRAAEFIAKMRQMPQAIQNAFREVTSSGQLTNDELQKTNDQLANQISKLEGHHQNNLVIAIDDARIAADKLSQALDQDNQKIAELLKTNAIGWMGSLVSGQDTTTQMAGAVKYWNQELANKGFAYNQAVHQHGPDSDQAKAAKAALDQRRKDAEANMRTEIDVRSPSPNRAANVTGDQSANLNIAQGYLTMLQQQDDEEALQAQNKTLTQKQQQLAQAKEYADQQKQLQSKQFEQWKDNLTSLGAIRDLSEADEVNYWLKMASTVKEGSDNYQKALTEANKLIAQEMKQNAAERDKWTAAGLTPSQSFSNSQGQQQGGTWEHSSEDLSQNSDYTKGITDQSKAIAEWLRNLNDGVAIQRNNADALAEQSLQMAVATGRMSRLDAAQVQAQLHTQEYNETLAQLRQSREAVANNPALSPAERDSQTSAIDNQVAQLNGQRSLQTRQDQAAIQAATTMGQLKDSAAQLATQFLDFGAQLSSLMTETIQGINQSLSSALMSHANSGSEYRRNIQNAMTGQLRELGSRGLNVAFQGIEGGLLGKFGGRKPDGTSNNPLYVKFAGAGGAVAAGASSMGSGTWSKLLSFLPHFAGGGDTPSNFPFVAGENGPELISLPHSAHVTPNNRMTSVGGGPVNHNVYIDASNSSDPAAVTRQVHAAMSAYGPYAVGASVGAMQEQQKRVPLSRR